MIATRAAVSALAVAALFVVAAARAEEAGPEDERKPEETPHESLLTETVEVHATRLPDAREPIDRVPAHATVLGREAIERAGVSTLQDLLGLEAGIVLYDQVGNDLEKRLDLRGFADGTGTRVYLDGTPLNDTRSNDLALQLVPLEALEQIDILRGSAANSAGGGAEAGVIHLRSLAPRDLGGALRLAAGSDGTERLGGTIQDRAGRLDWTASGFREETDGFRANAGGDLQRLAATVGLDLGSARRIELSLLDARSDLGNPGALTAEEIAQDPTASPFNQLDSTDRRLGLVRAGFDGRLGARLALRANVFGRESDAEILTTGRAAPLYGGFFLDSAEDAAGATLEISHDSAAGTRSNALVAGAEWLDGETEARGFFTPPDDPGAVDPASPASLNLTERRTLAVYVQDSFHPAPQWTILGAARFESDRVGYRESIPDPTLADARTFSELSLRAGAVYAPAPRWSVHASWGESFLPPSVEQLFAFPLFGSNPALRPQDSRTLEIGARHGFGADAALVLTLLRVDTEDEILFVPGVPPDFIGKNENAGRTRRLGVEAAADGRAAGRVAWFARLTLLDAEFHGGTEDGNRVPLVPALRLAAGADVDLGAGWSVRADALRVGEQVLDNDAANEQPELDAYTVVNARLAFRVWRGAGPDAEDGLDLFAEARNLLDEAYATRGIWAFDFSSGADDVFLTPAPGRRVYAGAEWRF